MSMRSGAAVSASSTAAPRATWTAPCAVKVLTAELDEENRARFFREQRAMGRLTGHPNIVNILQVGATAQRPSRTS